MLSKKDKKALDLIRKHNPSDLMEAHEIGLRMKYLDSGVFRDCYRIKDSRLVIKFPNEDSDAISHSRVEVRRIKKLAEHKVLAKYMPEVYYHNSKTGVVVMEYCSKGFNTKDNFGDSIGAGLSLFLLGDLIRKLTGVRMDDVHDGNLRLTVEAGHYQLKFIDLGY
jgi:hypothetical protein